MESNSVFSILEDISYREQNKGIIIDPSIALNEAASDIFKLIDGNNTIQDIANNIVNVYDIDNDTAITDIVELFEILEEESVICRVR